MVIPPVVFEIIGGGTTPQMPVSCQKEQMISTVKSVVATPIFFRSNQRDYHNIKTCTLPQSKISLWKDISPLNMDVDYSAEMERLCIFCGRADSQKLQKS